MQTITATAIESERKGSKIVFIAFCVWSFVLLGRPQDYLPWLAVLKPASLFGVMVIIFYVFNFKRYPSKFMANGQCRLFLFLLVVMLASVPFAIYRGRALQFLFGTYIYAAIFFYMFYKIVSDEEKLTILLWLACFAVGLYSLVALYQGRMVGSSRLLFGEMFDPNDLAFFVLSFLPFNFLFVSKNNRWWKRIVSLTNIGAGVLLILMSGSRGGFVGLGLVVFMLFFAPAVTLKWSHKIIISLSIIGVVVFGNSVINFYRLETIMQIGQDYNVQDETGRLAIWKKGVWLMFSNPLTGVGVACFEEAIGRDRLRRGIQEIWQSPHNSLVQIGAETGIIGLILFVLLSYRAFKIYGKTKNNSHEPLAKIKEVAKIGFVGHFVAAMFLSQAYSMYWVFYIVLSSFVHQVSSRRPEQLQGT